MSKNSEIYPIINKAFWNISSAIQDIKRPTDQLDPLFSKVFSSVVACSKCKDDNELKEEVPKLLENIYTLYQMTTLAFSEEAGTVLIKEYVNIRDSAENPQIYPYS